MGVIADFGSAAASLVKLGPKINREQRREIRDAVGQLSDELDRALQLSEAYLLGAKSIRDRWELAKYLRGAQGTLMSSFNEYKVCAGLYDLHDRFDRAFDPVRFAVTAGSGQEIRSLIGTLGYGERMIIDDLDELMRRLHDLADTVDNSPPDDEEGVRREVHATIGIEVEKLRNHRRMLKTVMREVFKNM